MLSFLSLVFFAMTNAYKVTEKFGKKLTIWVSLLFTLLLCLALLIHNIFILVAAFLAMQTIFEICYSALNAHEHDNIPDNLRASLISFTSMACTLFMAIMSISLGWLGGHFSLTIVFMSLGILSIIIAGILLFMHKGLSDEYSQKNEESNN